MLVSLPLSYCLGSCQDWSAYGEFYRVLGPGLMFFFAWGFLQMLPAPLAGGMYLNQRVAFLALPLPYYLLVRWAARRMAAPCLPR